MSTTTKKVTRRAIMSGVAALPAVAVLPTVADAAANPDAELLALGAKLDQVQEGMLGSKGDRQNGVGCARGKS